MTDGVTICFFNRIFDRWPTPSTDDCTTPTVFTHGPDNIEHADAVVFHLPSLDRGAFDALPKPPGQVWVAWSKESRARHPEMNDRDLLRRVDLEMTYERSSDVWTPYFSAGIERRLLAPPPVKTATAPVVWMQSNARDSAGRKPYFAELARRIWIDSFGEVGRNRHERVPPGEKHQLALYRQYKFTLAFENSFSPDYVTEKFWLPLIAGSVPVYRGTKDVASLAPTPDCYIDARNFATATELGDYLDHLDRHDDDYAAFHRWRSHDVSASFKALLAQLREPSMCRLAALVAARR